MQVSKYLCIVIGEQFERVHKLHPSTHKRMTAFALAIHIPVLIWTLTGYIISKSIFDMTTVLSVCIGFFLGLTIYIVERIVLATPKNIFVNILRFLIGLTIATLGASTVDLVIFDREITEQLQAQAKENINKNFEKSSSTILDTMDRKKNDWLLAQEKANCEANGTCGSKVRSVGPVYRELARQAETLRKDYLNEKDRYELVVSKRNNQLDEAESSSKSANQAGLLARIEALHIYTSKNIAAFLAWLLFFLLVLFFELMVVIAKLVFDDTVDDELDRIRESISKQKAKAYAEAITSPTFGARELIQTSIN
jgi:hypothetical protein